MFKTDDFLFLSAVSNIKQAKESVNECKRIVENINEIVVNNKPFYNTCKNAIYDGINLINNIDVAIENVKKSLGNLDSSRLTSKIKFLKLDDSSTVVTNDTYNIDRNSLNAGGFSSTNKQSASKKFDMHETLLSDYGIKDSIFSSNLRVKKVLENSKEEYDENSLNMIWHRYTKNMSELKKNKSESSSKFSAKYQDLNIEIDTTLEEKKYLKELLAELNSNGYKIEDVKKFVCASGEKVYIKSSANTKEKVNVWDEFVNRVNEIYEEDKNRINEIYEQDKLERRNQFLNNGYTLMDIFEKYYDMNVKLEKQITELKEENFYKKYPDVYDSHKKRIMEELYKQLDLELYNAGYSFEEACEYAKKLKYDSLENFEKKGVEFFVGINAFASGIGGKVESVVDGAIYLVGMPVVWGIGLFGDDVNTKMVEKTIKDIVGHDFSNDMYIDLVDSNKELPTDVLYGSSYKKGSTIADFVGTIGSSILATPLAVSSGFLSGVGETAEIGINNGDSNWATYLRSLVNGVSTASEVYGYNKMISGIKNFVSSGTLKKLGEVSLQNIKNISSSGFKNIGKNVLDFSINNLKTLPSTLGKSFLTTVTDKDMLVETGCMLLDNVISGIEKGNFNFDEALGNVGFVFLVNYAMNFASSTVSKSNIKNQNIDDVTDPNLYDGQPTDKIFDSDATEKIFDNDSTMPIFEEEPTMPIFGVDDTVATTTVATGVSNSRTFNTYDEFVAANAQVRTQWEAGLTDRQKTLIKNYIGESEVSSYVTMNGIARGTCINPDEGTVTFYHAFGEPRTYTFAEYAAKYGESVSDLHTRTIKESAELDAAIRQCRLPQDTIVARGMDAKALSRFGIDINADSAETIMVKLKGTYSDAGFMSSTPVAGGGFTHKDINLIMDCPAGSACADFATFNPGEQEVLFPMGQQFNVDNVVKKDGKIYIYMTLKGGA